VAMRKRSPYLRLGAAKRKLLPLAALLTDAQSQGTKVASTVARDGKTEGISRSCENPGLVGKRFFYLFPPL
jgi:hypothetical protein